MQVIGWVGFALIQIFYLPQMAKVLKSKDVSGLALASWVVLTAGLFLSLLYAIWKRDAVFMAGNSIGFLQSAFMVGLIVKYSKRH